MFNTKFFTQSGSARLLCLCFCTFLLFSSCAAQISGNLDSKGAGNFTLNVGLKPRFTQIVRSFRSLVGEQNALVLDGQFIASSLAQAPGVASVSFSNTSPQTITGPVKITKIDDFLASGNAQGFIRCEQISANQGSGNCTITLSRETGAEILSLISSDIAIYLEALMAPIATGESMSKSEYLELVGSFYDAGIKNEIAESSIQASIDFPGAIQSVKNGTFSGRRAEFIIPLLDILVLEQPLIYEVVWK